MHGSDEIYASLHRARLFVRLARNSTFQRIICRTVYALAPLRAHHKWRCDIYLSFSAAFAPAEGGPRYRGSPSDIRDRENLMNDAARSSAPRRLQDVVRRCGRKMQLR